MTQCDMSHDCTRPVSHIGEKGYVYCAEHAPCRQGVERCRRMRAWERALIEAGKPLPSYKPGPKPKEHHAEQAALYKAAQREDYTGKVSELGMYSYDRPAYVLWSALANGLRAQGYSEAAALEWLRSKAARWALDGALGDELMRIGYEFGKGANARQLAAPEDCEAWAKENA